MSTPTQRPQPTQEQVTRARQYWRDLSDDDLAHFWKHYTTGSGAGMYGSVRPDSTFNEYLVNSAAESGYERAHDI